MNRFEQVQRLLAGRADAVALLEGMFAFAPVGLLVFRADGGCVLANAAYREMFGPPPEGAAGLARGPEADAFARAAAGETVRLPGGWRARPAAAPGGPGLASVEATFMPFADPEGRVAHVGVTYQDVSERDAAAERIARSENQLAAAELVARVGSWEFDAATNTTTWSDEVYRIRGMEPQSEPVTSDVFVRGIHPADREAVVSEIFAALAEHRPFVVEYRVVLPAGEVRVVQSRGEVVLDEGGAPAKMRGTVLDVTDRRRVEAERARLAAIVESSDDAIIGTDLEGTVESWNAGAERMYGWTRDEMLGAPVSVLTPGEGDAVLASWVARLAVGERVPTFETVAARKDGRTVAVSVSLTLMRDGGGRPLGIASISRDITERKKMQARLFLADRMLSVGTLASGVAHEINNPLGFILGNLDLLSQDVPELIRDLARGRGAPSDAAQAGLEQRLADIEQALADAREGARRVRTIVRDLKTFSRGDDEARGPVKLDRVLDSAVSLAWNEIRHRARLTKQYGDVPNVEGNEPRLGQVFLNLLINAAQAIPEGQADRNEIRLVTYPEGASRVVVEVHDTGVGIPSELVPRIFDPFFTTKPVGVGTGLGLSICHGIVAAYGGEMSVESERGKGTAFRVVLRAAGPGVPDTGAHAALRAEAAGPRRGRVLVVDDEPMFVAYLARALASAYDVATATSGGEALATLRAGARFDAIVCDLMMPDTTGMELHAALVTTSPSAADAMIFVTGGAFTPRATDFLAHVRNPRIDKPVDMARLHALLRARVG